jgi:putative ABC transport system permease protein
MHISESIALAVDAIRAQKLRSGLTLLSIGLGVFAIISSTSVVGSLSEVMSTQLADLGEHSFLIQRTPSFQFGGGWRKYQKRKNITYQQAVMFRDKVSLTNQITISNTSPGVVIKAGLESTDPNVSLIGADALYFVVNTATVTTGRAFTEADVDLGRNVAIIGHDIVVKLFPGREPVGQRITVKNQEFEVIGILEERGGMLGQSQDNRVMIPISVFVKYYSSPWDKSVDISVKAIARDALQPTMDEATGVMRALRGVKPWEDNSFEMDTNEALSSQFSMLSSYIAGIAVVSGLGALIVAGIGIMNMMLVSVKERTREIGVRKALGAHRSWIVRQFLIEAVTLSQIGGLIGMAGGMFSGFAAVLVIRNLGMPLLTYTVPWFWVIFSVIACSFIGIVFGLYPAYRAASLDPIEALRYE